MEISEFGEPKEPVERDNMKTERGQINTKFRLLRVKAGLTQKETEQATGIWISKISYFERGHEKPTQEEAEKLAEAFGVDAASILKCFPKGKLSRSKLIEN